MLPTSSLHSEDGGSMDLWNVSVVPQHLRGETTPKTLIWGFYCVLWKRDAGIL